jgi:hypothetical protein
MLEPSQDPEALPKDPQTIAVGRRHFAQPGGTASAKDEVGTQARLRSVRIGSKVEAEADRPGLIGNRHAPLTVAPKLFALVSQDVTGSLDGNLASFR